MADPVTCSQCGARNPADADWCSQCYTRLDEEPETPTEPPEPPAPFSDAVQLESGATDVAEQPSPPEGDRRWACKVCDTQNPLEESVCSACGTSIFESFGGAAEETAKADPREAMLRSVLFPGLGHARVGQSLLGVAIGGLTVMALIFGLSLVLSGETTYGAVVLLIAVGVWVVAALDTIRFATGATDSVWLKPRVVTALVGAVTIAVILAAVGVQGES